MNKLKQFWSELAPVEKIAELCALFLLLYLLIFARGNSHRMVLIVGLILICNGVGCIKRNPSNFKTSLIAGAIVIIIALI